MGQVEADLLVPPITGTFLFAKRGEQRLTTMDPHVSKLFNQAHDPYTDATLTRAIQDGHQQRRTADESCHASAWAMPIRRR